MNKLIIDATKNKIFLMIIINDSKHYITHENSKSNYEKLILLINELLKTRNLELKKIQKIYINRGPGSFAGIRNSLSIVNNNDSRLVRDTSMSINLDAGIEKGVAATKTFTAQTLILYTISKVLENKNIKIKVSKYVT